MTCGRRLVYVSGAPGAGKTSLAGPEIAAARYNSRVTHPVHVITTLPLAAMAEYDRPVGIGELVAVDTTVPVDVRAVAARVRGYHEDA
jgi:hypothetical protein